MPLLRRVHNANAGRRESVSGAATTLVGVSMALVVSGWAPASWGHWGRLAVYAAFLAVGMAVARAGLQLLVESPIGRNVGSERLAIGMDRGAWAVTWTLVSLLAVVAVVEGVTGHGLNVWAALLAGAVLIPVWYGILTWWGATEVRDPRRT